MSITVSFPDIFFSCWQSHPSISYVSKLVSKYATDLQRHKEKHSAISNRVGMSYIHCHLGFC